MNQGPPDPEAGGMPMCHPASIYFGLVCFKSGLYIYKQSVRHVCDNEFLEKGMYFDSHLHRMAVVTTPTTRFFGKKLSICS